MRIHIYEYYNELATKGALDVFTLCEPSRTSPRQKQRLGCLKLGHLSWANLVQGPITKATAAYLSSLPQNQAMVASILGYARHEQLQIGKTAL